MNLFTAAHTSTKPLWVQRGLAIGLGLLACLAPQGVSAQPTVVKVCTEPGDGPPVLYWKQTGSNAGDRQLAGFTVDLLPAVFDVLGRKVLLEGGLPWRRCMRSVALGEVDFAIGAYRDAERDKLYAFSKPYKTRTPHVFFSAKRPIQVKGVADLKRYRGCGMNGFSYAHYGLLPGDLDQGARNYKGLVQKTLMGHCDYFVEEREVMMMLDGNRHRYLESTELLHASVPDAIAPQLHFVAAKGSAAAALLPEVDRAIAQLQRSGEFQRLWKRHAGNLPY